MQPLLHPLLPPSLPAQNVGVLAPVVAPRSTSSRAELPIAAKFLRAVKAHETEDSGIGMGSCGSTEIPDMEGSQEGQWQSTIRANNYQTLGTRSHQSLPVGLASSTSLLDFSPPLASTSRSTSVPTRARHPLRKASSTTKLHKKIPPEELEPPILPTALREVLEVVEAMLEGHEKLAAELKKKWTADFPLVRGLGGIWSDQVSQSHLLARETNSSCFSHGF